MPCTGSLSQLGGEKAPLTLSLIHKPGHPDMWGLRLSQLPSLQNQGSDSPIDLIENFFKILSVVQKSV